MFSTLKTAAFSVMLGAASLGALPATAQAEGESLEDQAAAATAGEILGIEGKGGIRKLRQGRSVFRNIRTAISRPMVTVSW